MSYDTKSGGFFELGGWLRHLQLINHRMYKNTHNNYQNITRRKISEEARCLVVLYCGHVCVIRCYA